MIKKSQFFVRQNVCLKLIWIFLNFFLLFINRKNNVLILLLLNTIFFFADISLIKRFFKTCIRLSFFWISYLIMGIIFNINFNMQVNFILKFLCMLQVSVFTLNSFSLANLRLDEKHNKIPVFLRNSLENIIIFMMTICHFFDFFTQRFKESKLHKIPYKQRFTIQYIHLFNNDLKNILSDLNDSFSDMHQFSLNIKNDEVIDSYDFFSLNNLHIYFFITLNILLVSV